MTLWCTAWCASLTPPAGSPCDLREHARPCTEDEANAYLYPQKGKNMTDTQAEETKRENTLRRIESRLDHQSASIAALDQRTSKLAAEAHPPVDINAVVDAKLQPLLEHLGQAQGVQRAFQRLAEDVNDIANMLGVQGEISVRDVRTLIISAIQGMAQHAQKLTTELGMVREAYTRLEATKNAAYVERNKCVAAIARLAMGNGYVAGLGKHDTEGNDGWDDQWLNIVYVDLPSGQVSWHIHDSELETFAFLPKYHEEWDGHTTTEKYRRLENPYASPQSNTEAAS